MQNLRSSRALSLLGCMRNASSFASGPRGLHRANQLLEDFFESPIEIDVPGRELYDLDAVQLKPEQAQQLFAHKIFWRLLETRVREGSAVGTFFRPILDASEDSSELGFCIKSDDPVFPHYRMGGLTQFRRDLGGKRDAGLEAEILSFMCAGNAHKTASDLDWNCMPVTPAIGTQLPDAFAVSVGIAAQKFLKLEHNKFKQHFPWTAVTWACLGDGSIAHPTVLSAFNNWKRCKERGIPAASVLVVLDNGIAISTRPKDGEVRRRLREHSADYFYASGQNCLELILRGREARRAAKRSGNLAILHVDTVRIDGHSAQERHDHVCLEEQLQWIERDSLRSMAQLMLDNTVLTRQQMRELWHSSGAKVDALISQAKDKATTRHFVVRDWTEHAQCLELPKLDFGKLPTRTYSMRQAITTRLKLAAACQPQILFGCQDPDGHYGRFMGLSREHPRRVCAFPIDEVMMGGMTALGLVGILPVIENSYLWYEDQGIAAKLKERALLQFMHPELIGRSYGSIVCSPAFPGGPGGPTHNENSLPHLSTPGLFTFVPSCAHTADLSWTLALRQASAGYHVSMNEPTMLYAQKHLFEEDEQLCMPLTDEDFAWGDVLGWRLSRDRHLLRINQEELFTARDHLRIATFGRPVWMAVRALAALQESFPEYRLSVIDFPCMTTSEQLLKACSHADHLLVIDDSREMGSMGSALITRLTTEGRQKNIHALFPPHSFNPSGKAQKEVCLSDAKVLAAARKIIE